LLLFDLISPGIL